MPKYTGLSRKVDELGRVVLPIELRRNLDIEPGDPLDISVEDNKIVLQKHEFNNTCVICSQKDAEHNINQKNICSNCAEQISKFTVNIIN